MIKLMLALILFSFSVNAAYQSTEIVSARIIKVDGVTVGVTLCYKINDSALTIPPNCVVVTGQQYNDVRALNGNARKNAVWALIRSTVKSYYDEQKAQKSAPVTTEEEDSNSPFIGIVSSQEP